MLEPTPEAWAAIRHAYENTDQPLAHICAEHEVSIPTVRYRMKRWGWTRRKPFVPRQQPATLPLPSPGGEGSANAEGMSRGGVSFPHETSTPPRSQEARDPPPPEPAPGRAQAQPRWEGEDNVDIVPRLQAAVARVLPAIEANITRLASGTLNASDLEKAGRTLSSLTRTLRELNGLLAQRNAQPDVACPYCDGLPDGYDNIDDFRNDLARRIDAFIESRGHEFDMEPNSSADVEHGK